MSVWKTIKIREDEKKKLDELKQIERKRSGRDPSYSDIIDDMTDIILDEEETRQKKKKKKGERDFMELF